MWPVWLAFFDCGFHSVCFLKDKDKRFMEAPDGRDWPRGKLGLVLMGVAILHTSCNPIFCWWAGRGSMCVPSLLFGLRPNYSGSNEDNVHLLQKVQCPEPCNRPLPTQVSARDSWTLTGKSGSVSCWVTAPFSHIPQLSNHMPQLIVCRPQLKIPHAARKIKNPVCHN